MDANWHFIDNYGWKSGRHDIKVGYEFRRTTIRLIQDNTFRGKLSFSGLTSFLAGVPDDGGKIAQGDTLRHSNENSHALYIQDNFRITSRLQLNYGIRWDYFGVVSSTGGTPFYQFDPTALGGGGDVNPVSQLYDKDLNNFAPRFGFAYDVGGKGHTVIRGGWGLFYDAFAQDIFLGHVPYNCAFCPGPAYTYKGAGAISSPAAMCCASPTASSSSTTSPAASAIQVLRLTPRNHEGQYVIDWRIDVSACDCYARRPRGRVRELHHVDRRRPA